MTTMSEYDYESNYDLRPEVQASLPRGQEVVHLFVTTKAELQPPHTGIPTTGKWFNLLAYDNKAEFIAAAHKYALDTFGEREPTLLYSGIDSHINLDDLFDAETCEPSEDFWTLFTLSHNELDVLFNYARYNPILAGGVNNAMEVARDAFVGYFPTTKEYVLNKIERTAVPAEAIHMLGDSCDWEGLGRSMVEKNKEVFVNCFCFRRLPA